MFNPDKVGDRIAKVRSDFGLTQPELAKRLGVNAATVAHWEQSVSLPRLLHLALFCEVFRCNAHWLLFGIGERDWYS